eukprot:TRINITY_DN10182_c0_g1_i1.p1 TRINITY_DN10182_c0_g1~~TRINITY_DN10182_c0_g1_i1.p1  ORF type:complete len:624 (+),score=140.25 TRINITY_DN10182_c0_g1_i1:659-2530(+)
MRAHHLLIVASSVFLLVLLYPTFGAHDDSAYVRPRTATPRPVRPIADEVLENVLLTKPRFVPPQGWKSKGCGLGPPPRNPSLADLPNCAEVIASYEAMCGEANGSPGLRHEYDGIKNGTDRKPGDPAKYEGKYMFVCHTENGKGRPTHILAGAVDSRDEPTCGPPQDLFDVLDVRVAGPQSIEYAFVSTPVRWFKVISFRPVEEGEYYAVHRVHLQKQAKDKNGWEFKRKPGRRRLALLGSAKCPLSSCGKQRAHFWCMVHSKRLSFNVTRGNCSVPRGEELPLCANSYPGAEDEWFGRWYKECNGDEECMSVHPVKTRPLDALRQSVRNARLLRAVGSCGPSMPTKIFTKQFSHFVFSEKAGWVWHPHACRPRIFTRNAAWRCLNQTGLLSVGDSVQFTNGHLLWLWLDLAPLGSMINDTYFSVRGDRQDELFGTLGRGALEQSTEYKHDRMFLYQLVRQRNYHLKDLKKDLDQLEKSRKKDWNSNMRAVVMSIGLHDAVQGYGQPNQTDMNAFLTQGFSNLKYPVVFHPAPSASIIRMCSRKNNDRVWRVNSVYNTGFSQVREGAAGKTLPPIAITPSYFMTKSLSWEVPMMDDSGTHPYCSFVGMNTWMQTLDLICPLDA